MSELLDRLAALNRKERFYLVGHALGNPAFRLGDDFRLKLGSALDLSIPSDAMVAMDYHIDWIYAALCLVGAAADRYPLGLLTANQEDVDLLVAYDDGPKTHIIMVEAKGVTGWTNGQLKSKACRLGRLFGQDGDAFPRAKPHFAVCSPVKPSARVETSGWPQWMKRTEEVPWLFLPVPAGLTRVTRCDESGVVSKQGAFWKVVAESKSGLEE